MVRVLIADDETLLRTGLWMLLDGSSGIEVVAEARDGDEAVALARATKPDVVLMDIQMPRRGRIGRRRRSLTRGPS